MIDKLRRRFIRAAISVVVLVMALLIVSVNAINALAVDAELRAQLLELSENRGAPPPPGGHRGRRPPPSPEEPFETRYFVLRFRSDGSGLRGDWSHIAAVSGEDAGEYVTAALRRGPGYGLRGSFRFLVTELEEGEYLAVFLDCRREVHALRVTAAASCGAALLCAILAYALVASLSRRALNPVYRSLEKQKRFITDASHELKTPLSVIATGQKVLEAEVGPRKWIDKTLAQVDRLRELVEELVVLSRLEEEHRRPALFDAAGAVRETAESFRKEAEVRTLTLSVDMPEALSFCGDEYALRRLVSVLTENAVKYTPEGGRVRLTLRPARGGLALTAANTCAPVEEAELERLFDRFYRADPSRSRKTGGFGLGLSIAQSVAEAHNGAIRAEWRDGEIVFTARLQALRPAEEGTGRRP